MDIPCPKPAALTAIPAQDCPFKFDQILRLKFQRNTPDAPFTTTNPITTKAAWDALIAAVDSDKIVLSPIVMGVEIPQSEAQTEGGNDNSTPFGMEVYLGEGAITVTGQMRNLKPEVKAALKKLSAESDASLGVAQLRVFMVNKNKQIIHEKGQAVGDAWGIPIYNFRVSSMGSTGLNSDNITQFSFTLQPDWDENLEMSAPTDFNPLTITAI